MIIKYSMECMHCYEEFIGSKTLDLTQEGGEEIEINLDSIGGMSMMCPHCGCEHWIPNLRDYVEADEESCFDNDEDEEDDE